MLARNSSSHAATFRFNRRESLPGALRIRLSAICFMVGSQPALVIAKDHVQHPMEAVLDGPMVADEWSDQAGDESQRSNVETRLAFDLAASLTGTHGP